MANITRNSKAADSTSNNGTNAKPIHYVNFYDRESGAELEYRTIDKLPQVDIDIARKSPEACDKRFGNEYERAVYREAGVSKKATVTRNIDDF